MLSRFFYYYPEIRQRFLTQIGTGILEGQLANVIRLQLVRLDWWWLQLSEWDLRVVSAYNLPVGYQQSEAWARQNIPKVRFDSRDLSESLVQKLFWRSASSSGDFVARILRPAWKRSTGAWKKWRRFGRTWNSQSTFIMPSTRLTIWRTSFAPTTARLPSAHLKCSPV